MIFYEKDGAKAFDTADTVADSAGGYLGRITSAFRSLLVRSLNRNPEFSPDEPPESAEDFGLFDYVIFKKQGNFLVKRGLLSSAAVYSNRVKKDNRGIEILPFGTADVEEMVSEVFTTDRPLVNVEGMTPVLFIHGYSSTVLGMGGGRHTWGNLPYLLDRKKYLLAEFRWRTAQKFQDAAESLAEAVQLLYKSTGRRVHLVAHSFGGLLARTYIQNLTKKAPFGDDAASLITFGTPHSGISPEECMRFGFMLPAGQFFDMSMTAQISGYQAGQDIEEMHGSDVFCTEEEPGYIPALLSDFVHHKIPQGFKIFSVIGLTNRDLTDEVEDGDRVISYAGQRFAPILSLRSQEPLLTDYEGFGGRVTETVMGSLGADVRPKDRFLFSPDINGYAHSPMVAKNRAAQVYVKCIPSAECKHPAYVLLSDWLERNS